MTDARALRVTQHGGPEVLAVQTVDVPEPGPGQVRVRVEAAGLNFIDVYLREGIYPGPTPVTSCMEVAGRLGDGHRGGRRTRRRARGLRGPGA